MRSSLRFPAVLLAGAALALAGYVAGWKSGARRLPPGPARPSAPASLPAARPPRAADWDGRWRDLAAARPSLEADAARAGALGELAGREPGRALALALGEHNLRRRASWLHAVLRGWARTDPGAAAAEIGRLPEDEREAAEAAVLEGAAADPDAAADLALRLIEADPAGARSHANHLLSAFDETGDYAAAAAFALSLPAELHPEMLGTAFQYWGRTDPAAAYAGAVRLAAGDDRQSALEGALSGWSQADAPGLARYALGLPPGGERTQALSIALGQWVQDSPGAASAWLNDLAARPEFDAGVAAVATQPAVIARHPDVAASWAESIADPALRSSTLASVLQDWAGSDPAAADDYARRSPGLRADDRAALLERMAAGGPAAEGP
ncbi:MAG TPA: hypothetical protein VHC86_13185 [Opitutaceae bacterium]|nr:hypothetical protein [Opitutaceae bacterium]